MIYLFSLLFSQISFSFFMVMVRVEVAFFRLDYCRRLIIRCISFPLSRYSLLSMKIFHFIFIDLRGLMAISCRIFIISSFLRFDVFLIFFDIFLPFSPYADYFISSLDFSFRCKYFRRSADYWLCGRGELPMGLLMMCWWFLMRIVSSMMPLLFWGFSLLALMRYFFADFLFVNDSFSDWYVDYFSSFSFFFSIISSHFLSISSSPFLSYVPIMIISSFRCRFSAFVNIFFSRYFSFSFDLFL